MSRLTHLMSIGVVLSSLFPFPVFSQDRNEYFRMGGDLLLQDIVDDGSDSEGDPDDDDEVAHGDYRIMAGEVIMDPSRIAGWNVQSFLPSFGSPIDTDLGNGNELTTMFVGTPPGILQVVIKGDKRYLPATDGYWTVDGLGHHLFSSSLSPDYNDSLDETMFSWPVGYTLEADVEYFGDVLIPEPQGDEMCPISQTTFTAGQYAQGPWTYTGYAYRDGDEVGVLPPSTIWPQVILEELLVGQSGTSSYIEFKLFGEAYDLIGEDLVIEAPGGVTYRYTVTGVNVSNGISNVSLSYGEVPSFASGQSYTIYFDKQPPCAAPDYSGYDYRFLSESGDGYAGYTLSGENVFGFNMGYLGEVIDFDTPHGQIVVFYSGTYKADGSQGTVLGIIGGYHPDYFEGGHITVRDDVVLEFDDIVDSISYDTNGLTYFVWDEIVDFSRGQVYGNISPRTPIPDDETDGDHASIITDRWTGDGTRHGAAPSHGEIIDDTISDGNVLVSFYTERDGLHQRVVLELRGDRRSAISGKHLIVSRCGSFSIDDGSVTYNSTHDRTLVWWGGALNALSIRKPYFLSFSDIAGPAGACQLPAHYDGVTVHTEYRADASRAGIWYIGYAQTGWPIMGQGTLGSVVSGSTPGPNLNELYELYSTSEWGGVLVVKVRQNGSLNSLLGKSLYIDGDKILDFDDYVGDLTRSGNLDGLNIYGFNDQFLFVENRDYYIQIY